MVNHDDTVTMLFNNEAPIIIRVVYPTNILPVFQITIGSHLAEFRVFHVFHFWEVVAEGAERGSIILETHFVTQRTSPGLSSTRWFGMGLDSSHMTPDLGEPS